MEKGNTSVLPWKAGVRPLMLAPMQGVTNRVLRRLVIELARPDVVYTEFVRVRPGAKKGIKEVDRREMSTRQSDVPLVVQLIGRSREALMAAAVTAGELGTEHININLGCPFGRMSSNSAGGALLKEPADLATILDGLRRVVSGSLSVKLRSGYDDPHQVFSLLPLLEDCGIDFLVLHPRTVRQRYEGKADHTVTASLVEKCRLPVIANGDIFSVADFEWISGLTCAAGFMLGRGAIADPWLFERIRGRRPAVPTEEDRRKEVRHFLSALLDGYLQLFSGETQVLNKMKAVLCHIGDTALEPSIRKLKRTKNLDAFREHLTELENG